MSEARLISIQVGQPRRYGSPDAEDYFDQEWRSAIGQEPVAGAVWLGKTNLAGDKQADLRFHGGVDKAVNGYPSEHYADWIEQLQLALAHGAFGENFTTAGLTEANVCIGDVYRLGDAIVQVSQPRQPCAKLARRWRTKDLAARVIEAGKTGWYLRVLQEGKVEAGMSIELLERPQPQWTIAAANEVIYHGKRDVAAMRALIACPPLSAAWRDELNSRLAKLNGDS